MGNTVKELEEIELEIGTVCVLCEGTRHSKFNAETWCIHCGGSGLECTVLRVDRYDSWGFVQVIYEFVQRDKPPPYLSEKTDD